MGTIRNVKRQEVSLAICLARLWFRCDEPEAKKLVSNGLKQLNIADFSPKPISKRTKKADRLTRNTAALDKLALELWRPDLTLFLKNNLAGLTEIGLFHEQPSRASFQWENSENLDETTQALHMFYILRNLEHEDDLYNIRALVAWYRTVELFNNLQLSISHSITERSKGETDRSLTRTYMERIYNGHMKERLFGLDNEEVDAFKIEAKKRTKELSKDLRIGRRVMILVEGFGKGLLLAANKRLIQILLNTTDYKETFLRALISRAANRQSRLFLICQALGPATADLIESYKVKSIVDLAQIRRLINSSS